MVNSADIVAYLEHRYPDPPVYPADPGARVRVRAWERLADTVIDPILINISYWSWADRSDTMPAGLLDAAKSDLSEIYARLDAELEGREFVCTALSIADFALFPHLVAVRGLGVAFSAERHGHLSAWLRGATAREGSTRRENSSRPTGTVGGSETGSLEGRPSEVLRSFPILRLARAGTGSHGGEVFFARSTDGGRTFSDPMNLSKSIAGDGKGRLTPRYWHNGSLGLAVGPQGDLYAAWTEYEGTLWVSRSTGRGDTFSEPLRIVGAGDAKPTRGPSLAVDADGAVHLAWTVGEDPAADIRVAKSVDRARSFGEPRVVFETGGHADAPSIAVDGKGTLHLAYAGSPAGPFKRYHIRYTRSNDGGVTFEQPREISSPQIEPFESASFPTLDLDGAGDPYVVWELSASWEHRPQGLGFARSNNGGRTFGSPSVIPGTADPTLGFNGSLQGLLMDKLAVNEAGAVAVVNIRGQATGR